MKYDAIINGIDCKVLNTRHYSGLSTKEFEVYYTDETDDIKIIGIDAILYGEWITARKQEDIDFYISEYIPNILNVIRGIQEGNNNAEYVNKNA